MTLVKTQALVLKSIDWRDTSEVVSLFTRQSGRIDAIAKSSRILKSKLRGPLETMNHIECLISIIPSRSLQVITDASVVNTFTSIRRDLDKLSYSFAMMELTQKFFHEGEADQIYFDFLISLIKQLDLSEKGEIIFWFFLLKMCSYLGFKPEFSACVKCKNEIIEEKITFSIADGGPICMICNVNYNDVNLYKSDLNFLHRLQGTNYKTVSICKHKNVACSNYTQFLLEYLRFHTMENLNLKSLKFMRINK